MQQGLEALWSLEFQSNRGFEGGGVVIFETGRVFGGDAQYYYTGTYEVKSGNITAKVKVTRYVDSGLGVSIFGTDDKEIELEFEGKVDEPVMRATGNRLSDLASQVTIKFIKRADLP